MLNKLCGRTRQVALVASLMALGGVAQQAQACPTTPTVGSVCVTAISYCPVGYYEAAGQTLAISSNQVLYSLIGTTYGGDGATNFKLPDLRGRAMTGLGQGAGLPSFYPGQFMGTETVTVSQVAMPPHTHTATYTADTSGSAKGTVSVGISSAIATTYTPSSTASILSDSTGTGVGRASIWTNAPAPITNVGGITVSGGVGTVTVGQTGGGIPVAIIPPQIGLMHCIAYQGLYPQQP